MWCDDWWTSWCVFHHHHSNQVGSHLLPHLKSVSSLFCCRLCFYIGLSTLYSLSLRISTKDWMTGWKLQCPLEIFDIFVCFLLVLSFHLSFYFNLNLVWRKFNTQMYLKTDHARCFFGEVDSYFIWRTSHGVFLIIFVFLDFSCFWFVVFEILINLNLLFIRLH